MAGKLNKGMIRLSPEIDLQFNCPACQNPVQPNDWFLTGMHSMCSGKCSVCNKQYYLELPVNAGLFYPGILDAATGTRCDDLPFDNWYLSGLVESYAKRSEYAIDFVVEKNRTWSRERIVILNTIDSTYGHALFELFNAAYYLKQPDIDLVILVQKNMRWLVPEGAAQVWTVDVPFSKAGNWNSWLADRIKQEVAGQPNVYLCRSFVQADSLDYNIEDFSKVMPFPLNEWNKRLVKPTVTFIWRTDRFWKRIIPRWIDNRISRKIMPAVITKLKNHFEFRWILRFCDELRKAVPNIDLAIAGMDTRDYALPDWIKDFRYPQHSDETARLQCLRYAESHIVIGCNGSSLVLPGCHSGAVVDIVPGDQWAVSAGTFPFRVTSIGDTHFRNAMIPAEASIKRIVSVVTSILRDRALIELHTTNPWRDHETDLDHFAWSEFRKEAFALGRYFVSSSGLITKKKEDLSGKN